MNTIKLSDVKVPDIFLKSKPCIFKVEKYKNYYLKNGKLDSPIILADDNTLVDNYIRYLVAKELGLEEIPFVVSLDYSTKKTFNYVIGVFDNYCNKKYTWINKNNLPIKIGDNVLVYNKKNQKCIVKVVDTYYSNDIENVLKHKSVIRIIR